MMDLHTQLATTTLEGPLLDWQVKFGQDHQVLCDGVEDLLEVIRSVRRDAMIAEDIERGRSMARHPSQRGRDR